MRDHLRREIVTGALAPGSDLSEGRVAELYGYPAASIRTALQALEHEGLVIVRPRVGTTVHPVTPERTAHALHALRAVVETAVRIAPPRSRPGRPDAPGAQPRVPGAADASGIAAFLDLYTGAVDRSENAYLRRFASQLAAHLLQAASALATSGFHHPAATEYARAAERGDTATMLRSLRTHFDHAHRLLDPASVGAEPG